MAQPTRKQLLARWPDRRGGDSRSSPITVSDRVTFASILTRLGSTGRYPQLLQRASPTHRTGPASGRETGETSNGMILVL